MDTSFLSLGIFWASLGGIAYQIYLIIERLQTNSVKRTDFRHASFYLVAILNIILSGIVGLIYYLDKSIEPSQYMVAFQVGISAPIIFRGIVSVATKQKLTL